MKIVVSILVVLVVLIVLVFVCGMLIPANHVATRSIHLDHSQEQVWLTVSDFEHYASWAPEVTGTKRLADENGHAVWQLEGKWAMPMALDEVETLLHSGYHEARGLALLIWVHRFPKAADDTREEIHHRYLANTTHVNNWDLVDASAPTLVGSFLAGRGRALLVRLAKSDSLWERRIAVVATGHFIRHDDFADTLKIVKLLLRDDEDLIHKSCGWMLREVGKRDQEVLETFLGEHYATMPRTMLRYAIERFTPKRRRQYLRGEV